MHPACANLDRPPTYRVDTALKRQAALRAAVLQCLRDCMSVSEVVELARCLPDDWQAEVLKGWRPEMRALPPKTRAEFVARVLMRLQIAEEPQMQHDIARMIAGLRAMTRQRAVLPEPLLH